MSAIAPDTHAELMAIERRRRQIGVTRAALERSAGLAPAYYHKLLTGNREVKRGTIARLKLAISRLSDRNAANSEDDQLLMIAYRMAVALAARTLGIDPRTVHAQDPARRATQSAEWMAAAEVRRLAFYLLNAGCGLNQADVGRAAQITRQAVHLAVKTLEDRRDDKSFDRMLDELTDLVRGDW